MVFKFFTQSILTAIIIKSSGRIRCKFFFKYNFFLLKTYTPKKHTQQLDLNYLYLSRQDLY